MIILLLTLAATFGAVAGLIGLWRRRNPALLAVSIVTLASLGVCAFTAEIWFDWFGFNSGDGEIFIGFYLLGMGALAIAALALVAIPIVLALRTNNVGEQQA